MSKSSLGILRVKVVALAKLNALHEADALIVIKAGEVKDHCGGFVALIIVWLTA